MEKHGLAKDLSKSIKYMTTKPHPYPADKNEDGTVMTLVFRTTPRQRNAVVGCGRLP